jgi:hypothetical protein
MAEGDVRRKPHKTIDGIEHKHCPTCGEWKDLSSFVADLKRWDGRKCQCRDCSCKATFAWRDKNREHTREYNKQWNKDNPDKTKASKERSKIYSLQKIRDANNRANRKRRNTVQGSLHHRISNLIRINLKRAKQGRSWSDLVNYSLEDLTVRLNKTMPHGYTWDDFISGKLHIDHIIPVTAFNFSTVDDIDFKKCWSLSNLRLLPAFENMSKNDKLSQPFQPSLAMAV